MIVTCHWSATGPVRLRDYHVEFARTGALPTATVQQLLAGAMPSAADWNALLACFTIWKNVDFTTPTNYGTWKLNHDPRDNSSNVEVAAMCMGGESALTSAWGPEPFTIAHAWIAAGIVARVCQLENIDTGGSFDAGGYGLQNGPIYNVSTHAERALQTPDGDAVLRPSFGYFIYSGDPDSRWDLAALDPSRAGDLGTPQGARTSAIASAHWIRMQAHALKAQGIADMWQLDAAAT